MSAASPDQSRQIQHLYDCVPYPSAEAEAILQAKPQIPDLDWFNALLRPGRPILGSGNRVLIAGCGAGAEAFALSRAVPGLEIVGVDFSENSIKIARDLAAKSGASGLSFLSADLTDPGVAARLAPFDFISCHGVLDYIPDYPSALATLARLLKPDGGLYLGVNSEFHHSIYLRAALPVFGLDPLRFEDTPAVRQKLRALQLLFGPEDAKFGTGFHERTAVHLAGDLFGPVIHNLPLSSWIALGEKNHLHFYGSIAACHCMLNLPTLEEFEPFAPLTRAQIAELRQIMGRVPFQQIVFSPAPPANPPWTQPDALMNWRPVAQFFDPAQLPLKPPARQWLEPTEIEFKIGTLLSNKRQISWWMIEFLRRCDGTRSISQIVDGLAAPEAPFLPLLNNLYHFFLLNFLPPALADSL